MQTFAVGALRRPAHHRHGRQVAATALAVVVLWVIVGLLRGPSLAAAAFAAFESPRTVSAIVTTTLPPFLVQVQGRVTEAGGASYTSAQTFLVEPFTGWSINLSRMGLAPSG